MSVRILSASDGVGNGDRSAVMTAHAAADDVKVAIGQIDAWANQAPTLGMKAGIFQKHGIVLETFGTQGAGETLQAVIAGSADIGIGIGTAGAMRAFARGAPVRVIAAAYVGVGDQYWYVPANSPLKSLADATEKNTLSLFDQRRPRRTSLRLASSSSWA